MTISYSFGVSKNKKKSRDFMNTQQLSRLSVGVLQNTMFWLQEEALLIDA